MSHRRRLLALALLLLAFLLTTTTPRSAAQTWPPPPSPGVRGSVVHDPLIAGRVHIRWTFRPGTTRWTLSACRRQSDCTLQVVGGSGDDPSSLVALRPLAGTTYVLIGYTDNAITSDVIGSVSPYVVRFPVMARR